MKRAFNPLVLALLVACATTPTIPANRYGLQVVPDLATYERITKVDPDRRLVDLQSFIPGIVLDIFMPISITEKMSRSGTPTSSPIRRRDRATTAGPRPT